MAAAEVSAHFLLVPLMSPGHLLPMVDIAKILAQRGVTVSILTTPHNSIRITRAIKQALDSGCRIRLVELDFPAAEAGLPPGCENMDLLPSRSLIKNFFHASSLLQHPLEQLWEEMEPRPDCIISGKNMAWTVDTARKFKVPRLFFDGMGTFAASCTHHLQFSKVHVDLTRFDPFVVPGLPHRVTLSKARLPEGLNPEALPDMTECRNKMIAAESVTDGIIINTFEELEGEYVEEYRKVKGCRIWCIGPVSACNGSAVDKAARGKMNSVDVIKCVEWMSTQMPNSVIYASLGSICGLTASQLIELGLGLEASNRPFIWVIRSGEKSKELEKWIVEEGFEERIRGRGFLIRGWSPQLLILSHPSTGAFLTHCGWNSTIEGLSAGVPIIACPLFAEQFMNEQFIVQVLKTGVSVGVEAAVTWGLEEKSGLVMKREDVKKAIEKAMDDGEEAEERRRRAREIAAMAKRATAQGGSSSNNVQTLIQDIMESGTPDSHGGHCQNVGATRSHHNNFHHA